LFFYLFSSTVLSSVVDWRRVNGTVAVAEKETRDGDNRLCKSLSLSPSLTTGIHSCAARQGRDRHTGSRWHAVQRIMGDQYLINKKSFSYISIIPPTRNMWFLLNESFLLPPLLLYLCLSILYLDDPREQINDQARVTV